MKQKQNSKGQQLGKRTSLFLRSVQPCHIKVYFLHSQGFGQYIMHCLMQTLPGYSTLWGLGVFHCLWTILQHCKLQVTDSSTKEFSCIDMQIHSVQWKLKALPLPLRKQPVLCPFTNSFQHSWSIMMPVLWILFWAGYNILPVLSFI